MMSHKKCAETAIYYKLLLDQKKPQLSVAVPCILFEVTLFN